MLTAPELAALAQRLRLLPAGRTSGNGRPQLLALLAGALRADPPAAGHLRVRQSLCIRIWGETQHAPSCARATKLLRVCAKIFCIRVSGASQ